MTILKVNDYAKMINKTPKSVYNLINSGKLESLEHNKVKYVVADDDIQYELNKVSYYLGFKDGFNYSETKDVDFIHKSLK